MRNRAFSRRVTPIAILATAALVAGQMLTTQPAFAATTANLVQNPGAEAGAGSADGGVVPVPHWKGTNGACFTAIQYGAPGFPSPTTPGPANRGKNFFACGPSDDVSSIVASQTISLSTWKNAIKHGGVTFSLSAWLGGVDIEPDQALVEIDFKDQNGALTGAGAQLPAVTPADRGNMTGLVERSLNGSVPTNARSILVQLILERLNGAFDNAYADNLSIRLSGVPKTTV